MKISMAHQGVKRDIFKKHIIMKQKKTVKKHSKEEILLVKTKDVELHCSSFSCAKVFKFPRTFVAKTLRESRSCNSSVPVQSMGSEFWELSFLLVVCFLPHIISLLLLYFLRYDKLKCVFFSFAPPGVTGAHVQQPSVHVDILMP